jgi:hypothetical protein
MCISKRFLDKPLDIIYLGLSFIQNWRILMKPMEKTKMEVLLKKLLDHAKTLKVLDSTLSDVGFI